MRGSSSYINIEKNLKHLAKRYKSVKYSLGLTILFLMMGLNAFSEEILEKESLHNSVKTLQESSINGARRSSSEITLVIMADWD